MHSRLSCQPNFWQDDIIVEKVFFYNPFFPWILHCSWIISWRKYVYDNFCCCYINYDNLVLRPSFFSFVCVHITFSLYKNILCGKTIALALFPTTNCISIYTIMLFIITYSFATRLYTSFWTKTSKNADVALFRKND